MAVFTFDSICAPVIPYNFEVSAKAVGYHADAMPALACGFFTTTLSAELMENPVAMFSEEDKVALKEYVGKGVIWMEESSPDLYPNDELFGILKHEEAHIVYGDTVTGDADVNDLQELRADAYAASYCGKTTMTKALQRTILLTAEREFGKGVEAINKANKALENNNHLKLRFKALK